MLADVQRMATPELTRIFGQHGLYLRPSASLSGELSGNMLANVISLHRVRNAFGGQLQCLDAELPISSGSLSLVYSLFILESSADPEALMQEIARSLKPEGVALIASLNPWSPARLRWLPRIGFGLATSSIERMAREAGLDLIRKQFLGPYWPTTSSSISDLGGNRWRDGFRAASLLVLRRREAGLTPLRKASPAVSLRPGMSAG
jgi:SAM-dependent methyltransferase